MKIFIVFNKEEERDDEESYTIININSAHKTKIAAERKCKKLIKNNPYVNFEIEETNLY